MNQLSRRFVIVTYVFLPSICNAILLRSGSLIMPFSKSTRLKYSNQIFSINRFFSSELVNQPPPNFFLLFPIDIKLFKLYFFRQEKAHKIRLDYCLVLWDLLFEIFIDIYFISRPPHNCRGHLRTVWYSALL